MPNIGRRLLTFIVERPHLTVVLLICITLTGFISGVRHYANEARLQAAYDTAKTFQASITALHQYYSTEIEPRARAAGVTFDMNYRDAANMLPFPATVSMEFGDTLRTVNPILSTNLYSQKPFPIRKGRVLDAFEMESLTYLERNPTSEFYRIETINGQEAVRYAAAVIMKQVCADCHNRPEFGFEGDWKEGDFRGARQVSMPVPDITPIVDMATTSAIILAVISSCLGGLLVWPVVSRLHASVQTSMSLASQLETKNKALEEASRVKNQFLAGISHDLRNPLNGILGFSSLLNDQAGNMTLDEKARTYAGHIHESSNNLKALIDELLEISSIESGNWNLVEEDIDPAQFLSKMFPLLENTAQNAGMTLTTDAAESLPALRADSRALMRIVNNLVENAAKYSKGSTIAAAFAMEDDGALRLQVSDDGQGMAAAQREGATEFGHQNGDTELPASSYGIGLWSVETLASLHGAEVTIDSCPKHGGCRVSVHFPAERVDAG